MQRQDPSTISVLNPAPHHLQKHDTKYSFPAIEHNARTKLSVTMTNNRGLSWASLFDATADTYGLEHASAEFKPMVIVCIKLLNRANDIVRHSDRLQRQPKETMTD